jgi:hypothetical protein
MPSKPKTSPVIRTTLAAMRAVDALRDARLEAAIDAAERERIQGEYWQVMRPLLATLHEAQFGPPVRPPTGLRLITRDVAVISPRAASKPARAPRAAPGSIYQLKVTLRDSRPPIWRRIEVPANTSLSRLHAILQTAMGWTDAHLHSFVIRDTRYGDPDMEGDPLDQPKDERRVRVGQLVTAEGARFTYEYDFGDGWAHEIVLEKRLAAEPGVIYPRCIAGKRVCLPEDVVGPSGYAQFLTAIRDPPHAEHDDLLRWAGGAFDPAAFDRDAINRQLERLAR